MRRYGVIAMTTLLGLGAVVAAAAGASAFGSQGTAQVSRLAKKVGPNRAFRPATTPSQLKGVNFESHCDFSHRNMDDPIVFPGKPGKSHDHTFIGNDTTNAFSTLASLSRGTTSCERPGDTAAYWAPTLIGRHGEAIEPRGASLYYRRKTLEALQAFPPGFKMITGDSKATAPQDEDITFWNCGPRSSVKPTSTIPTCPDSKIKGLALQLFFPDCWDGVNLDSPDHRSHVAYSSRWHCPADHPVALPLIQLIIRYPTTAGAGYSLSSGGQFSGHADFFNAWDQGVLVGLVNSCLNALRKDCGQGP